MPALCPLSPNATTGVERSGRSGDATAATTAAATTAATATADAGSATQQHRELTNNGGDSPIGIRDSCGRRDPDAAISGPEPGSQDRTARTSSGTQAGSRLQKAYQAVTREQRVRKKTISYIRGHGDSACCQ